MKPSAIRQALPRLLLKKRAVMLWGAPGVGKSDLVANVAKDMGIELRDVRLSMLDPVDLKGFPTISTNKKQMTWLPADFLPTKGKGILFLDEINHAPNAVQAPAYQLIHTGRLGDYRLPVGWSVMAAGNRTSDKSIAHAMPAALSNRFVHLDYDVNIDDWVEWATDQGIHTDVRAFIRFKPSLLHKFDSKDNPRAFPTPRSWAFVNDIYKDHLTQDTEFELIRGTVGDGAASEFIAFTRQIKDLPTVDEVLKDPKGARMPENPASMHAIAAALDIKTTVANMAGVMQYIERMPVEFQVLFMRSATRRELKLTGTKTFSAWVAKHADVLT